MIKSKDNTVKVYQMKPKTGSGAVIKDINGKEYIDLLAGVAVNLLGYNNKAVNSAAIRQINKYIHTSRLIYNENQEKLAKKLEDNSFGAMVYFVNSGAEATEVAVKFARKWGLDRKKGANEIITFKNSFHGRTIAALSATGQEKFHKILNPVHPGFVYAEFNDINDVKKKITSATCAVFLEPIQAEGGVNIADVKFIKELRALCTAKKILLILDEVQTGLGRTGKLFAYENYGITPDVMTLGKGLGGGLPLAAVVVSKKTAGTFAPGDHGTTMGGNPVACAAGNAVVDIINKKSFLKDVADKGKYFVKKLKEINSPKIKDIRGTGLLIGLELYEEAGPYVVKALAQGLILNSPKATVIRIVPPLVITKRQIDKAVEILKNILV